MTDHELDAQELSARDCYRIMTDVIAPRPIAWVSTVDGQGRGNLAPFSYFQAVCSDPPTIILGVGSRGDGSPKDTLANILGQREFTVNHVTRDLADPMNASSADYAAGVSEWEALGVEAAPGRRVAAPRVSGAIAALECRLQHAIPIGNGKNGAPSSTLLVAEVVHFYLRGGLLQRDEKGRIVPIAPAQLAAVGRLGGIAYTDTRGAFELPRPPKP